MEYLSFLKIKQFIQMKHFIFLLIASGFTLISVGQSNKIISKQFPNHTFMLSGLMQEQNNTAQGSRMVPSERVIEQSTYDNYFHTKSDSVKLNYVLNGISTYDFSMLLYPYNYPYSTSPTFNYLGIFTKPQVEYNSYSHWTINPNTLIYGFYEKDLAGYDIYKNLIKDTALFADSSIFPNKTFINNFNASALIDSSRSYVYQAGVSNKAFKQLFSYTATNKVLKDSTYEYSGGAWHLVSKTFYTYDVSNNLIQIDNYSNNADLTYTLPLVEQLKYTNTYDASNRLKTVHTSYFDGTSLMPSVIDTFAYTGTYSFHLSWKEYQYDAINSYWAPMTFMTKTLNGGGFPDVITIKTFDSLANAWVPSVKQMMTYNTNNNPTKLDEYIYNFTSFPSSPDFTTHYYYESFVNTTSLNDQVKQIENITVYPNPANNILNISGIDKKKTKALVSLYDMQGRILTNQEIMIVNGNSQLSISDFSRGNYLLLVRDEAGDIIASQPLVIIK